MTRLALAAMFLVMVGCGGAGTHGTGGGSGNTGGGTGNTGGGSGNTGGGSGGGNTFAISGTVRAPTGGDVHSTVIIACAWVNNDCDTDKTVGVEVTGSGASVQWQITGLNHGYTYFIVFWKDLDGSQDVSNGDYTAVATDQNGNVRAFTDAATGLDTLLTVKQTVTASTLPSELVGDWLATNSSVGVSNRWSFRADGSSTNEFILTSSTCTGGTAIVTNGVSTVSGTTLTFAPTDATKNSRCNGTSIITQYYANGRQFSWRVAPSTQGTGNALFLTDLQQPEGQRVEAELQPL